MRPDELILATLEHRLAAIASGRKEEGYEFPTSVAEGPFLKMWKGIVREKTRQQDAAPPLMVEDLKSIIEHLPRCSTENDRPTGKLTFTSLADAHVPKGPGPPPCRMGGRAAPKRTGCSHDRGCQVH